MHDVFVVEMYFSLRCHHLLSKKCCTAVSKRVVVCCGGDDAIEWFLLAAWDGMRDVRTGQQRLIINCGSNKTFHGVVPTNKSYH